MIVRPRLLPLLLLAGCSVERAAEDVTANVVDAVTVETAPDAGAVRVDGERLALGRSLTDWPATGFNYAQQRFSPLDQLTPDSVRGLTLAWTAPLAGVGDAPLATPVATPIVSGEIMYATGAGGWVRAFDVRSGDALWSADPKAAESEAAPASPPAGAALWKGRLFVARPGGRLASFDAKNGRQLWSHGIGPEEVVTSAPLVAQNLVFVGVSRAGRGSVVAYDYNDGSERWRFWTAPSGRSEVDGAISDAALAQISATWAQPATPTLPGTRPAAAAPTAPPRLGAAVVSLAYDPANDRLVLGTGDARQPGDGAEGLAPARLFSRSVIAVDARTGEFAWHRQLPGTSGADRPFVLAELAAAGGARTVAMQVTGAGELAIVDLADGALLGWRPLSLGTAVADGAEDGSPTLMAPRRARSAVSYSPDAGLLFVAGLSSAGATGAPALLAVDPVTGAPRWSLAQVRPGGGTMATAGGLVFQGSPGGRLTAYAIADGRPVWGMQAGGPVVTAPSSFLVEGAQCVAVVVGGPVAGGPVVGGPVAGGPGALRLIVLSAGAAAPQQPPLTPPAPSPDTPSGRTGARR